MDHPARYNPAGRIVHLWPAFAMPASCNTPLSLFNPLFASFGTNCRNIFAGYPFRVRIVRLANTLFNLLPKPSVMLCGVKGAFHTFGGIRSCPLISRIVVTGVDHELRYSDSLEVINEGFKSAECTYCSAPRPLISRIVVTAVDQKLSYSNSLKLMTRPLKEIEISQFRVTASNYDPADK